MADTVFIGMRTHNSAQTLDNSLKSIYAQDYPNLKIVIYDDCSSDSTMKKIKTWQKKFTDKNIDFDIVAGSNNVGCGKAFENLGRVVADKMNDKDIFVMLDSDDSFVSSKTVSQCVQQMNKTNANICIAGFQLQGDMNLVLNWDNGTPHNTLSHQLGSLSKSVSVEDVPEISSKADSIGWTKIVKGEIFKPYMQIFPQISKEMSVCEDFPSLAMFLFKKSKITGLKGNAYNYFKHTGSSTVQARPEDFSVIRIGFLKILQKMVKDNRDLFVPSAEKHINSFLETKYAVISQIVDKKSQQGYLHGYSKADFQNDFKRKIDCSLLRLCDRPGLLRQNTPKTTLDLSTNAKRNSLEK